ncbi:response regulator transcription factor [Synechocystis sp. B12]|nr:response regulator transcription factor [Synechocystis sp. B12]
MKILIVEDDPLMQLGLEQALGAHERFEIIGRVDNGYGAVQQAAVLNPDLIVMDIGLPGLDGIEATKQIKQTSPRSTL